MKTKFLELLKDAQKEENLQENRGKNSDYNDNNNNININDLNVDPTIIYGSDDMLVTDSYFSLLHYATGEEMVTDAEWKYFLDCLNGNRVDSRDEKLQMTDKNNIGGSV